MTEKVLLVDDDPNVLKAYERRLRRKFDVETALCSEEGITAINFLGPFAVVVSDMTMPRENGAEFLSRILEMSPESVRIMLTGNADQPTAAAAINQGRVFRFLNKPCEADVLEVAIREGIAEHQRIRSEKELLSQTLVGAVEMLSKVLSLTSPGAFGRGARLKEVVTAIADAAGWDDAWRHEAAALLSPIGCVAIPPGVLAKVEAGHPLTADEQKAYDTHPQHAEQLIAAIPRLESIARVVANQNVIEFDDEANEEVDGPRSSLAFGVRLLRLARDFDALVHDAGLTRLQAVRKLRESQAGSTSYDAESLNAMAVYASSAENLVLAEVSIDKLAEGMRLVADVTTTDGAVLVTRGHDVTAALKARLQNFSETHDVRTPLEVELAADLARELEIEPAAVPS